MDEGRGVGGRGQDIGQAVLDASRTVRRGGRGQRTAERNPQRQTGEEGSEGSPWSAGHERGSRGTTEEWGGVRASTMMPLSGRAWVSGNPNMKKFDRLQRHLTEIIEDSRFPLAIHFPIVLVN
jgi:hypothetical protein